MSTNEEPEDIGESRLKFAMYAAPLAAIVVAMGVWASSEHRVANSHTVVPSEPGLSPEQWISTFTCDELASTYGFSFAIMVTPQFTNPGVGVHIPTMGIITAADTNAGKGLLRVHSKEELPMSVALMHNGHVDWRKIDYLPLTLPTGRDNQCGLQRPFAIPTTWGLVTGVYSITVLPEHNVPAEGDAP